MLEVSVVCVLQQIWWQDVPHTKAGSREILVTEDVVCIVMYSNPHMAAVSKECQSSKPMDKEKHGLDWLGKQPCHNKMKIQVTSLAASTMYKRIKSYSFFARTRTSDNFLKYALYCCYHSLQLGLIHLTNVSKPQAHFYRLSSANLLTIEKQNWLLTDVVGTSLGRHRNCHVSSTTDKRPITL